MYFQLLFWIPGRYHPRKLLSLAVKKGDEILVEIKGKGKCFIYFFLSQYIVSFIFKKKKKKGFTDRC